MKLQDQLSWDDVTDENLRFFRQIGVDCLVVWSPPGVDEGRDLTDDLVRMKAQVESHGLEWYVIQMTERCWDEITLGLPGRDEKIEHWCTLLRSMGAAGIPVLGYVFNAIGHFRTAPTTGRGGAVYSTFDYGEHMAGESLVPGKQIGEEELWDNFGYFLKRVVPVAEEADVKLALHPDDPPIPEPLGGAARIVSSVENYKRAMDLVPSDHNAIEFCQGCFAEMGTDVIEAIRYFGSRNKIMYVHFRNIRGTPHKFQEVFIDEGDVDMLQAMQIYKEVGFRGPFMMDHTPGIEGDTQGARGRAYASGYIRALMQVVYR